MTNTGPFDETPSQTMKVSWRATREYTADISYTEARDLFGLGGTSDGDLPYRISVLVKASPSLLMPLMDSPDSHPKLTFGYELRAITDPVNNYTLWPEE